MELDLENQKGVIFINQHTSFVKNGYCIGDCKKCIHYNNSTETCEQVSLRIEFPLFEEEVLIPL